MSDKVDEYVLLKIAEESLSVRGILLKVDLVALQQIEEGTWTYNYKANEKPIVRSYINIDIVSKIMMYIEDLVVYAKSFMTGKDYYTEFLRPSTKDLGEVINCFFENIERVSDDEILKIMSWTNMSSIISDSSLQKSVKIVREYNITKARNLLKELRDFGKSNHPLYKRFKHGGMPVVPDAFQMVPKTGLLSIFETFSVVSVGDYPMRDIHIIPFSNEVLERYQNLIAKLQRFLGEMISNRMECIQRKVAGVFPKSYPENLIAQEDVNKIQIAIQEYNTKNPAIRIPHSLNYNVNLKAIEDRLSWYFKTY